MVGTCHWIFMDGLPVVRWTWQVTNLDVRLVDFSNKVANGVFVFHAYLLRRRSVYITGSCLLRGIMATSLSRLGTHVISFRTHSHAQCVLVTSLYEDFTTIGNLRLVYVCRVLDKDVKIQIGYKTQYSNGTDVWKNCLTYEEGQEIETHCIGCGDTCRKH